MSLYEGRNMTKFKLNDGDRFSPESLEALILQQVGFSNGENRRVQVHFAFLFLKGLGCSEAQAYQVLTNVTGVKRPGLMYHLSKHTEFLQKTEEQKIDENNKHPGRPSSFNDEQLGRISDFVRLNKAGSFSSKILKGSFLVILEWRQKLPSEQP